MKVTMIAAGVASLGMIALSNMAEAMPVSALDPGYSNVFQAHYRVIYRCPRRGQGYTYGYERGLAPRGDIYGYSSGEGYRTRGRPAYGYNYSYGERYGMRGRHEGSRAFMERREGGRYGAGGSGARSSREYGGKGEGLATGRSSAQGRTGSQGGSPGMMNKSQGGSPMEGRSVSPSAPKGQQGQTPQIQRGGASGGQGKGGGTL